MNAHDNDISAGKLFVPTTVSREVVLAVVTTVGPIVHDWLPYPAEKRVK